MRINPESVRGP